MKPLPKQSTAALTLAAIGVVYGDIGTSPLYTLKEIFAPATGVPLDAAHLIGATSTIVWALMLVVTLKYVILILRADNQGEGGVLALTALASRAVQSQPRLRTALLLLGVSGATLFYGDSVITPAISVLGAMEGLKIVAPTLEPYVVPASVAVLVLLFMLQRHGTAFVGRFFGPIIVLWFGTLAVTGLWQIQREPAILAALNPQHAWWFLLDRGPGLLLTVGAIVLALTGVEALYADLGHFGRRPIRIAWLSLVLPALALNYMGQAALLITEPAALENPFFRMFSQAWLLPALVLATLAAIIASQAVISGAYSLTRQAIQLGFLPRMAVHHTSAQEAGQIYLPRVNTILLVGVLAAVLGFGSSSALAGAYGIAVTLTMMITTVLTYVVVRRAWKLPAPLAIGATLFFLALDALLFAGCAVKLFDGGWFPLALGLMLMVLMVTWWRGRRRLLQVLRSDGLPLPAFVDGLDPATLQQAERTAVYAVAETDTVPQALLHNLKHNQVLHQRNVILTVRFHEQPWVPAQERADVTPLGHRFWQVRLNYGFMESPDVPRALAQVPLDGSPVVAFETTYFLSRETVVPLRTAGVSGWGNRLFAAMNRQAGGIVEYFRLPDNAVVELGTRVQI